MPKKIIIKFPVELPEIKDKEVLKIATDKAKEAIVFDLFQKGKISSGYAATLLGLGLADFMEVLKKRGIPFTQYDEEDWKQDKKAAGKMIKPM